ncbi:unnamed protein product, partial [Rotaria sp. Silwood1]
MNNLRRFISTTHLLRTIQPKSWIPRQCNMTSTAINQSLYNFSEEERMIKETVARFGKEHVEPYVRQMEEAGGFKPELIKAIFDQGLMAIDVPLEYGGSGQTFFAVTLAIEEMSKIDPSIGSFCLSEPTSGSDAFALKTTAKKQGDYYILNGTKMWISNAEISGVYIVMANANPQAKHKGISAFIVDRDTQGLRIGKREKKLGLKASSTCLVHFDDCK